jgi:MYXO-CTERM domain-containing protein
MFGLLDGNFLADIEFLGRQIHGNFDVFRGPLALAVADGLLSGEIVETPTGDPLVRDVLVRIPLSMTTQVDASLFADSIGPGQLFVGLSIDGLLEATGQITVVPEPPSAILALAPAALAAVAMVRRRTRHSFSRARSRTAVHKSSRPIAFVQRAT